MIKNLRVPVFILSAMLLSASNAGAQYKAVVKSAPTGAAAFAGASFGMTPAVGAPLATGVLPTLSGSFVPTNPVVAAADFHAAVLQSGAATTPQRASALTGASKNAGSAAVTQIAKSAIRGSRSSVIVVSCVSADETAFSRAPSNIGCNAE
ncbi:MAG: hypothetical protein HYZ74_08770, partial [Elusimicrobia bacterium]|nr:hypothetical protein [Elusimicrobiota bacterium]